METIKGICEFLIPCDKIASLYCNHSFCDFHCNCRGKSKWTKKEQQKSKRKWAKINNGNSKLPQ